MPFISVKLDAKEAVIAPEARYDLRVQSATEKKTGEKSKIPGEPMLEVMITNESPGPNGEKYSPIFHTLMIPTSKTPEKNLELYKLNIQRFLNTFNITGDSDGFDTDDFPGAEAKDVLVVQDEGDDDVIRNKLKLDRLPDEEVKPQGSAGSGPRGRRRK